MPFVRKGRPSFPPSTSNSHLSNLATAMDASYGRPLFCRVSQIKRPSRTSLKWASNVCPRPRLISRSEMEPARTTTQSKLQQKNGSAIYNGDAPPLPAWTATNPYAAQLDAAVVKQDMELVRAGLLYGLDRSEIHGFLTGRHGQSDNARFYAHCLVDSVRGQSKGDLATRRGPRPKVSFSGSCSEL